MEPGQRVLGSRPSVAGVAGVTIGPTTPNSTALEEGAVRAGNGSPRVSAHSYRLGELSYATFLLSQPFLSPGPRCMGAGHDGANGETHVMKQLLHPNTQTPGPR